jgi:hypothetical protein
LYERVGGVLDTRVRLLQAKAAAEPGVLSPFDLPGPMAMDTSRAKALGYRFDHTDDWLDLTIRQHDLAFV